MLTRRMRLKVRQTRRRPCCVIPPPVRRKGFGSAIVASLEEEAELRSCRSLWLSTTSAAEFFDRLGYVRCDRAADGH
jgi:N-acetylglutamate synthase-like GNAT family acetyltransferase